MHGRIDGYCSPESAQAIYDRATGPKEIDWLDSENHIDIYDRPELVEPAVARVARFMAENLGARTASAAA